LSSSIVDSLGRMFNVVWCKYVGLSFIQIVSCNSILKYVGQILKIVSHLYCLIWWSNTVLPLYRFLFENVYHHWWTPGAVTCWLNNLYHCSNYVYIALVLCGRWILPIMSRLAII
jgi:hypothetical protein